MQAVYLLAEVVALLLQLLAQAGLFEKILHHRKAAALALLINLCRPAGSSSGPSVLLSDLGKAFFEWAEGNCPPDLDLGVRSSFILEWAIASRGNVDRAMPEESVSSERERGADATAGYLRT
jgi:hypothetical protein